MYCGAGRFFPVSFCRVREPCHLNTLSVISEVIEERILFAKIEKHESDVWLFLPDECIEDLKLSEGTRLEVVKSPAGWCLRPLRLTSESLEKRVSRITPDNLPDRESDGAALRRHFPIRKCRQRKHCRLNVPLWLHAHVTGRGLRAQLSGILGADHADCSPPVSHSLLTGRMAVSVSNAVFISCCTKRVFSLKRRR